MIEVAASVMALGAVGVAGFWGTNTLARRAFATLAVAAAAAVLTGALGALVPGDPVAAALGEDASEPARHALREEMGLNDDSTVFGPLVAGGRVLTVCATGKTLAAARESAYRAIAHIDWPEGFCRRDIGWRALRA